MNAAILFPFFLPGFPKSSYRAFGEKWESEAPHEHSDFLTSSEDTWQVLISILVDTML